VAFVTAEVPLATMFGYADELHSMTQGKGTFTMEFSKCRMVPASLQDDIIARRKAEKEERLAMA
jgi:elongation factor G